MRVRFLYWCSGVSISLVYNLLGPISWVYLLYTMVRRGRSDVLGDQGDVNILSLETRAGGSVVGLGKETSHGTLMTLSHPPSVTFPPPVRLPVSHSSSAVARPPAVSQRETAD